MKNMYVYVAFVIGMMLLLSCGGNQSARKELCNIDSLISENKDSAALAALNKFDVKLLDEDNCAYYNLLKVRAMYKLDMQIRNDSLIDGCMAYYKKRGNDRMLAEAYYYKSVTNNERCDVKTALIYMKMAEETAESVDDDDLKYKIFEKMSMYNENGDVSELSLYYGHKSLQAAMKAKNNNYIAYAYTNLAIGHMWSGRIDSADHYANLCMPYLIYMRPQDRAYVYDVLGEIYLNENADSAEVSLKKAVEAHPLPWTYNRLAELYMKEGREAEADSAWRKALEIPTNITVSGLDTKIEVLESMRKLKRKYGRHREADSLAGVIIAMKDSARARREAQAVRETQERYDEVREDEAAGRSLRMWTMWAAASAAALLALSAVYVAARRRYVRKMGESARRQAEYELRMVELGKDKRRAETRMRAAEREARRRLEAHAEYVAEGRRLYERLQGGGTTDGWTRDDYLTLLEYLRTVDAEAVAALENDYDGLSPREAALTAMMAAGCDDRELMRMFNVKASSLRTMKSRVQKKRK